MNPAGKLAWLTRKIFTNFVLPVGLNNGDWTPGGKESQTWIKNLIADIQISRTIRMVLREENAKALRSNATAKFYFEENQ